jgi:23S rRNA (cytosine1962-C5)-methyltransferase
VTKKTATAVAQVLPRGVDRIRNGHLWIYRSDVAAVEDARSGDIVRVNDRRGRFMAWAHYGAESEITLRIISTEDRPPDLGFWRTRLKSAHAWRNRIASGRNSYRLVHAEGDLLPGLVIDRYGDTFSMQTLTRGMESLKQLWVELLLEEFRPSIIVERNDVKVRELEGLPMTTGVLHGDESVAREVRINENGIEFLIDLVGGQKTGAFLDQTENRERASIYAHGRGLDCFTFHGSFALNLARGGCETVRAIDISVPAIERASENAALNNIGNVEFIAANVFDELHRLDQGGERFDTIVLDPPAFAKNRSALAAGLRGYKEINLRALKILNPGGVLITCSCSYHVSEALFMEMLAEAANDAARRVQVAEKRTQGRDHPILLTVPETYYLKCVIMRCM